METSKTSRLSDQPTSWAEYEELGQYRYRKVDWKGIMDLGEFVSRCTWRECYVEKIKNNPCPFRCRGCKAGTTRLMVQAEYRQAEEDREKAAEEAKALNDRAEEENPGLYQQDKLWLPHAPGVALIRGDLLADVANFFSNCDIAVHEHNQPATNRSLKGTGADIAWASENDPNVSLLFMRWHVQVRVQIVKFRGPSDEIDLEHPLRGVLSGMRGAHGSAMRRIVVFLGSTGGLDKRNFDNNSSYWFHSASGLADNFWENIGDTSLRMIRVPKCLRADPYEMMLRFGLERGKKRAEHFVGNHEKNVRVLKIRPIPFDNVNWRRFEKMPVEPAEGDESEAPGLDDTAEDSDGVNLSDESGSPDESGMPLTAQERAAIKKGCAEQGAQTLVRARAALEKERAAEAASEEEEPTRYCAIHRQIETFDEHTERLAQANATLRKKRNAEQAAWELAEAQDARGKTPAEAIEVADDSQSESGETTREERGDSTDRGSRTESGDAIDVEGELEEHAEDEPRRYIGHLAPEYLRRGGKVRPVTVPVIVISDSSGSSDDEP